MYKNKPNQLVEFLNQKFQPFYRILQIFIIIQLSKYQKYIKFSSIISRSYLLIPKDSMNTKHMC